jgi:hypothetical protein
MKRVRRLRPVAVALLIAGGSLLVWIAISRDHFGAAPNPPTADFATRNPASLSAHAASPKVGYPPPVATAPGVLSKDMEIGAVCTRIDQLRVNGEFAEALAEGLEAYEAFRKIRAGSSDCQFIMGQLVRLGRVYPPALDALRNLRNTAMRDLAADPTNRRFTMEVALLNSRLGENEMNIALLESLPRDGPQYQGVALIAYPALVEKGHYADALAGKPFGQMVSGLDSAISNAGALSNQERVSFKKHLAQATAKDIEVLVGACRYDDAQVLAQRYLQFDNSEEARELLTKRIRRIDSPKS